ncbi:potassium/sodium hyperpolarization-activated cyclic nucleotide-gated channel 1 isoform X4 [Apis cerana]|uniref:potassium/sodium hyperpolarization-activated cyclic nucleotide-gated channel 1 isoform X4 n=1 Tax=Apis cerana TaxID=7461 RepID=UPI002B22F4B7|nr:potassium/sodium hyperpolarization-activated cyclic nucleotide-gated channel 1 isoform X4 [Apis cerana]
MDLMAFVPHFTEAPILEHIPVTEHICEQPKEEDEIMAIRKGNRFLDKLSRWFMRQRVLYKKHPLTRWCVKSTTAVNYEISRHLKSHPYMIHPFSSLRIVWDSIMIIFTFVALLITPIIITFYFDDLFTYFVINDIINIVFLCDIIMWFFTGYYDYQTKLTVLDPMIVARKYLQSYFLIDFLPILPIGIFIFIIPNSVWYCATLNMMKLLRIRNILACSKRLHDVYRIYFQLYKILETCVVIILSIHWAACLEYYVPLSVYVLGTLSNESWINSPYFQNRETRVKKYVVCLHRSLIAFSRSCHFLDMKTKEDIILNMILMIIGCIGAIYLLTQFSQLITTFHITIKHNLKLIAQLLEYMRYKELPSALQLRLLTFYHYRNKKVFERNQKIIEEVSPYLREEIILHNYLKFVKNVELFKHLPKNIIIQLTGALQSEIYIAGDEIVKAGTRGEALYFISSGTVAVYNSAGKEICHLEDESYFGEIALVMDTEHRIATIIAVETCEIYVLYRHDFRRFIAPYPDLLNRLQNVALENLNQSVLIDPDLEIDFMPQYVNISTIQHLHIIYSYILIISLEQCHSPSTAKTLT